VLSIRNSVTVTLSSAMSMLRMRGVLPPRPVLCFLGLVPSTGSLRFPCLVKSHIAGACILSRFNEDLSEAPRCRPDVLQFMAVSNKVSRERGRV
jgi:hypothetical protein